MHTYYICISFGGTENPWTNWRFAGKLLSFNSKPRPVENGYNGGKSKGRGKSKASLGSPWVPLGPLGSPWVLLGPWVRSKTAVLICDAKMAFVMGGSSPGVPLPHRLRGKERARMAKAMAGPRDQQWYAAGRPWCNQLKWLAWTIRTVPRTGLKPPIRQLLDVVIHDGEVLHQVLPWALCFDPLRCEALARWHPRCVLVSLIPQDHHGIDGLNGWTGHDSSQVAVGVITVLQLTGCWLQHTLNEAWYGRQ